MCIIIKPYKYLVAAPAVVWHLLSFTVRDIVHGKIYLHSSCEDSNSFPAPRAVVLSRLHHLPKLMALISKNHSAYDEWIHVTLLIHNKHVMKIWYSSGLTTSLKTVRQCISHWIHTMIMILGESLLAIKLYLIMTSFLTTPTFFS